MGGTGLDSGGSVARPSLVSQDSVVVVLETSLSGPVGREGDGSNGGRVHIDGKRLGSTADGLTGSIGGARHYALIGGAVGSDLIVSSAVTFLGVFSSRDGETKVGAVVAAVFVGHDGRVVNTGLGELSAVDFRNTSQILGGLTTGERDWGSVRGGSGCRSGSGSGT